jgi:hypothetical protein
MEQIINEKAGFVATPAQIKAWKAQYGANSISKISIDGKACYMRKPDRNIIEMLSKATSRQGEILVDNCWLGGDEEMRKDDEMFFALVEKTNNLIQKKVAEVEKQ